jgi:hypothetical protein
MGMRLTPLEAKLEEFGIAEFMQIERRAAVTDRLEALELTVQLLATALVAFTPGGGDWLISSLRTFCEMNEAPVAGPGLVSLVRARADVLETESRMINE